MRKLTESEKIEVRIAELKFSIEYRRGIMVGMLISTAIFYTSFLVLLILISYA